MTYGTRPVIEPVLDQVSTYGPWSPLFMYGIYPGMTTTYEAANRTVYIPISVPVTAGRVTARRVWWANGNTVNGASTIHVGIYTDSAGRPATKLVSASAAQAGTNTIQYADSTDVNLSPGRYWLAICSTGTTNTQILTVSQPAYTRFFSWQESTATPVPTTATTVARTNSNAWVFGFSTVASP